MQSLGGGSLLGVANAGEAGPADVRVVREQVDEVLGLCELLQVGRPPDSAPKKCGGCHCC